MTTCAHFSDVRVTRTLTLAARGLQPGNGPSLSARPGGCGPRPRVIEPCDAHAGPPCTALDHASALLLLLVRDCKINKSMLVRVGVPAIVRALQQHGDPRVSPTTVQALSGVVTLLAMSKTMLDLVQQTGGLRLVLELLEYRPPEGHHYAEGDVLVRGLARERLLIPLARPASSSRQPSCARCMTMALLLPASCGRAHGRLTAWRRRAGAHMQHSRGSVRAGHLPLRPVKPRARRNRGDARRGRIAR